MTIPIFAFRFFTEILQFLITISIILFAALIRGIIFVWLINFSVYNTLLTQETSANLSRQDRQHQLRQPHIVALITGLYLADNGLPKQTFLLECQAICKRWL